MTKIDSSKIAGYEIISTNNSNSSINVSKTSGYEIISLNNSNSSINVSKITAYIVVGEIKRDLVMTGAIRLSGGLYISN